MTTAREFTRRHFTDPITGAARREKAEYAGDEPRPLGGYLTALGVYGGLCASMAGFVRLTGTAPPERVGAADLALVTVATHKLSRVLTKDPVTSPLRAPFTHYDGQAGPAELAEDVREDSPARHSAGELLTCPFCAAQWVATGFVFGLVVAPRFTRLAASVFTAVAGADTLQYLYARLEAAGS